MPPNPSPQRYVALDAMRGFVMLVLASGGFGLGALIKEPRFHSVASQFHHVKWEGLIIWELVMPSFMFMVGASLPLSLARRAALGATFRDNLRHTALRAFKLILLGQFLTTLHAGRWRHEPYETLTQLGLSYFCCFLILQLRWRWQAVAAAALMLVNWGLYQMFPGSAGPFSPDDNIGVVIDKAVFRLNHAGSWATINFLGSTVTVLAGAWTGRLLLRPMAQVDKLRVLLAAALACLGAAIALATLNPVIHKAWTASFTLWHTAFLVLGVAVFFWLFDLKGWRRPALPLVVVGMNSIFIYMLIEMLRGWLDRSLAAFTGRFQVLGAVAPAAQALAVTLVMWCACYWLYRRKIFFKV